MATTTDKAFAMWLWPLSAAKFGNELVETMLGAQRVISARLPVIAYAMLDPLNADHPELTLMASEKVGAFGRSRRSVDKAASLVRRASHANAQAAGKLARGDLLWPGDWIELAGANLTATTALAALPGAALAPLHKTVKANEKRLRR